MKVGDAKPFSRTFVVDAGTPGWLTPWRFAALLGVLILATFPQVVTGLEAFVYGDAGHFAYPVAFYHRESFWRGELPLWNPLNSCGIPFLAQWNTLTLYPPSLFYLLLPLPWSFGIFCLAHLFVAGLGMYYLAYRWTGCRLAAAVAGGTFAFNGMTWYGVMWPHILAGLAWMPWVVWTSERAWREGRRALIPAVMLGTVQMLSGGAEVILLTWLLLGALWLYMVRAREIRLGPSLRRFLALAAGVVGLAAVQLLPFLDLLAHSQRNTGAAGGVVAAISPMPLTGWANFLVPLFHYLRNSNGVFVQAGQGWTGSYYAGVGTLALAILAVWRSRARRAWLLAVLTLLALLLALGSRGPVYDWFRRIFPGLSLIRFPVKFVLMATFALPLLAALGVGWFEALPPEKRLGEWKRVIGLGAVLVGLICLIVGFAWKDPLPGTSVGLVLGNACVRAFFLAAILGCLGLLAYQTDQKLRRLLQAGLVALLWFDVFTHFGVFTRSSDLSPTAPVSALEPNRVREFFKWNDQLGPGQSRAMLSKLALWQMVSEGLANPEQDIIARRRAQFMNLNLLDGIPKFDGFYSMDIADYLEVFKHVYFTTNAASATRDFLGISQVSNPTNIMEWVPRGSFRPLVTAGQAPRFADKTETMRALLDESFDPGQTVYLPREAQGQVRAGAAASAKVLSSQFSSHRLRFEVTAEAPAMVVVAQTFYHPWRALVDGRPVPLWRANYAFQALEIPAGKHAVNLVYHDTAFLCGSVVTLFSLLAWIGLWLSWRRTRWGASVPANRGEKTGPAACRDGRIPPLS